MHSKEQMTPLSERLRKVLQELEDISKTVEASELPSNDNADDFLSR